MDAGTASNPTTHGVIPNIDDIHANTSLANKDPFKFSHGLTGVDQPSNYLFVHILGATALVPMLFAFAYRLLMTARHNQRRTVWPASRLTPGYGRFITNSSRVWNAIKRHFLYASLWTSRHDNEASTLRPFYLRIPSKRPQAIVIAIYTLSNIAYSFAIPNWPRSQSIAEFRGRCGTLAALNLIFTILFALRNNPLIQILHVSYDSFNLFHRCAARLVVSQSIAHVSAFAYNAYAVTYDGCGEWDSVIWVLRHSLSYRTGLTAFVAFVRWSCTQWTH